MPRLGPGRAMIFSILLFAIINAILPNAAWAQGGSTGAITATVLDRSGGFIPNAAIKIIDAGTGQQVRDLAAGANGGFTVTLLPPGNYTVVVNAPGFGETRVTAVVVRVTETTTINVVLQPRGLSEKVEVSAQVVSVNTENATTGQTIEQQVVGGLPLATRNFQQLLTLSSGASSTLNNSEQLGRGTVRINVNGQRGDNNNYLIEGISATDNNVGELTNTPLPSPDVIQEFKVQTSLYDASQGRNGGGMVNAVLRTGTNEWHGDAFEFFRNDVLNASDFFLNRARLPRPELKQNIFGSSVGGPLAPEGKFGYIFGNYQGSRQRSGADLGTLIGTVIPVLPADRSDASLLAAFFPGNPNAKIDPVVSKLLNAKGNQFCSGANGFLVPSASSPSGNFNCSNPGRFSDNQFTTNWDRKFRDGKDKFGVRFFFSNSDALKPFGAGGLSSTYGAPPSKTDLNFPLDIPLNTRFLSGTWTHTFSGEKVNQFAFGYNRINNAYTNVPVLKRSALGITSPTDSVTNSIYKFTFNSSGFQIGPSPGDNSQVQNNFTYGDIFSWVRGKHELRFGGEWDRINLYKLFPQIFNDQIFFSNTLQIPAAATTPAVPAFTDFQNFLQGAPQFVFGQSGAFNHDYHHNNMSAFAQDDWKATQNLTLNVGLRLEEFGAWYDNACHIGNFDPSLIAQSKYPYIYPKCVNKFNVQGLQGTASSTTLNNSYARGWGPRIGLAYDVFGHHTTTVRAGFGIYYVQQDVGAVDNLSFQSPLLDVVSFGGPGGCLATFFQPGSLQPANCQALNPNNPNALPPAGVISPAFVPVLSQVTSFPGGDTSQAPNLNNNGVNLFTLQVPRHFRVPSVQQWNLTAQRSLGHDWVFEVGYVGSHSVHLREVHDALQSILVSTQNPLALTLATGQTVQITKNTLANAIVRTHALGVNGYGAFEQFADDAYGHYNSIQATLSRRWSNGYIQAAYTFSRSTDASSSYNTAFNTLFNNQLNLNGSRGLSDFDRTHRLAVSYLYNLPFFAKTKDLKGKIVGGWALSGVSVFQTGLPFSIIDSSAGSAFDALTTIPNTTASLASGATLASGLTSGSIGSRLGGNGQPGYLKISAFVAAPIIGDDGAATGFGTLGRNTYRGPFQQNWDVSLIKNFSLTEHQKIRFTSDFFNVWNHPVFSNPAFTDIQNPAGFGQIISTENNPRILQFSLTWSF
ncbi:MAG TPA: carboxypeptidase-like regulatory domain-containing protein [Candidatus Acidoferrum sp.]|nr:carboxypeptidase-like regulatory domain-containing protein [Candidatus Acidoferrum sp.]